MVEPRSAPTPSQGGSNVREDKRGTHRKGMSTYPQVIIRLFWPLAIQLANQLGRLSTESRMTLVCCCSAVSWSALIRFWTVSWPSLGCVLATSWLTLNCFSAISRSFLDRLSTDVQMALSRVFVAILDVTHIAHPQHQTSCELDPYPSLRMTSSWLSLVLGSPYGSVRQ